MLRVGDDPLVFPDLLLGSAIIIGVPIMRAQPSNEHYRHRYLFGDSDVAARRLEFLAQVFAQSTKALLTDAGVGAPAHAVDLGCGPGYSTRFLAQTLGCQRVSGLDNSQDFVSLARSLTHDREGENISFHLHDITKVPFPVGPANLLYCRFLITHLAEPEATVSAWATQLESIGYLLMEEAEWIDTSLSVFTDYIEMTEAMLASQSNSLYPGELLDKLEDTDRLKRRLSRVYRLSVNNADAATMFYLNLQSLKDHPFIRANYAATEIQRMEQALLNLSQTPGSEGRIEWGMRQLVLQGI